MLKYFKIFLFFFFVFSAFSQELPPISNYTSLDYDGGNQNWSISQSVEKEIYVGNNTGLLEYNGEVWKTYPSPNGSIVRAVNVVDDIVYTSCYMEFGYWKKDKFGDLNYYSLNPKLDQPMIADEEFWNIIQLDSYVLFQSLHRIYIYNLKSETFSIINSESTRSRIFKNNGIVYFQKSNKGLFKIEGGKDILVSDDVLFKSNFIIGIFDHPEGRLIITEKEGFFLLKQNTVEQWNVPINKILQTINIYSSTQLSDDSFILGTISDGVYHINKAGELIEVINQKKGLNDNTILSVFEDVDGNVWLALNNGIGVLNFSSAIKEYTDKVGKLGVVYTAAIHNNHLYLGTNQGLFYKQKDNEEEFKIIENTNGQVWYLKVIDGVLFCGHNDGTYIVDGNKATIISTIPGAWGIKKIPGHESLLIQGNYTGFSIFEKTNKQWSFRNKIEGFDISGRFFEFSEAQELIVNHEFKGLFTLTLDNQFRKVVKTISKPVMGSGASLVNYQNNILYTSNNGVFKYNKTTQDFEYDSAYSQLFFSPEERPIGIIVPDIENNKLWAFTDKNIISASPNKFNGAIESTRIAIPEFFRRSLGVQGFENITSIAKNKYLIGISNGFITLDIDKLKPKKSEIALNSVAIRSLDSTLLEKIALSNNGKKVGYRDNNIYFKYSVPNYDKYTEVNYQYQLKGFSKTLSTWSQNSEVSFENLPWGNYNFTVTSKVGNTISENTESFAFTIARPWYASNLAIIAYFLILGAVSYLVHRLYRRYYRKQQALVIKQNQKELKRKKIKAEKKLIQIKNEKLKEKIDNKSRELAISTMSIIKKNEFLNTIKSQLQESSSANQIKTVIKTIDRNINNDDDWKLFEDAFNNADKEFLKKVQKTHSELTPNDLRLCAYLRLNLSSKEIAPLLNISVRSVEVKRYRLRKKMNLPHENSLTDYILKL